MLNITGLVKVTKFEDMSEKAVKACVYFGTKKGKDSEEWENSFFNAVLVGSAIEKLGYVEEKDSIFITSGLVKNVSYEDKQGKPRNYLSLTVFDFEYEEDKIAELLESNKSEKSKPKTKKKEYSKKRWTSQLTEVPIDDNDIPF